MKRKRSCCRALSLSLLTIFNFTIPPLAPLAACAQPGCARLARPGQSIQEPAAENIVVSANAVPKLTGGVKEQHRLNLAIAIVKTWPGGVAPTPPPEATQAAREDNAAPSPAVPLKSMRGEVDDSAPTAISAVDSADAISDKKTNIAEAFPNLPPSYLPGNSYDVPGTIKTTSTTTTSSTTSTTSSTDWGNSNSANSQSSNSKWKSSQKSKGGTHMGGLGFGGFFHGFAGFGAGFSGLGPGLGLGLGGLGYGFAMPRLRMPSFNLGGYGGFAMGGGLGLYGLWNGYKHSQKSRGSSSTSSIANNNRSWGNTTTNNISNNTIKTTTTTETTPGYTVEQSGSGIYPVPAQTIPVAAQTAPTQTAAAAAPAARQALPLPAVSHPFAIAAAAKAVLPTHTQAAPALKPDRIVVVPWDDWYRCFAGEVYQRWSVNEPYAGDALVAITVTNTKEISVALLPSEQNTSSPGADQDSSSISAEERDNFNRLVLECLAKFNHDKAIAMPKESRRKSVTFVLGFSAEEDGPSGCQALSMTDSEQYYEKAADKPKAVSMALPAK